MSVALIGSFAHPGQEVIISVQGQPGHCGCFTVEGQLFPDRGHIAFRTDDIAAFKKRLDEKGIPYSDYGSWAMNGWHQIFFYDPDGNVIEVHQVNE